MADLNIQRDAEVFTPAGKIGTVAHVIVDHATREVTDLVVTADGNEYLVPMGAVTDVAGDRVCVCDDNEGFRRQRFEHDRYQTVDDERVRLESRGEARHGGAPLRTATDDAVDVTLDPTAAPAYPVEAGYQLARRPVEPVQAADTPLDRMPLAGQGAVFREGPVPDAAPLETPPAYRLDEPMPVDRVRERPNR